MWTLPENPRGVHAVRVLSRDSAFTLDRLIAAAYDPALPAFEPLLPPLFQAFDALPAGDSLRARLAEPRRGPARVGPALGRRVGADVAGRLLGGRPAGAERPAAAARGVTVYDYMATALTPRERLDALDRAVARLGRDFGRGARRGARSTASSA
jgi:acyl-homoserine-lactone acylase